MTGYGPSFKTFKLHLVIQKGRGSSKALRPMWHEGGRVCRGKAITVTLLLCFSWRTLDSAPPALKGFPLRLHRQGGMCKDISSCGQSQRTVTRLEANVDAPQFDPKLCVLVTYNGGSILRNNFPGRLIVPHSSPNAVSSFVYYSF